MRGNAMFLSKINRSFPEQALFFTPHNSSIHPHSTFPPPAAPATGGSDFFLYPVVGL